MSGLLWLLGGFVGLYMLLVLLRSGNFWRSLLFSALGGNAALFTLGWLGSFTGMLLAVNLFTLLVASLLGIPGVLTMLILKLLFSV